MAKESDKIFDGFRFLLKGNARDQLFDKHFQFRCYSCPDLQFTTVKQFRDHCRKACHLMEESWQVQCCGRLFRELPTILLHLRTHVTDEPVACKDCDREFHKKKTFVRHRAKCHMDSDFKCEACRHNFPTREALTAHNHKVHAPKAFRCTECPKRFSAEANLKRHLSTHAPKTKCRYCEKEFSPNGMYNHVMGIHSDKYKCTYCDFSTGKLEVIRNHLISHEKVAKPKERSKKPLNRAPRKSKAVTVCPMCCKDFCELYRLMKHLRRVHNMENLPKDTHEDEKEETAKENAPVNICGYCEITFPTEEDFQKHIEDLHPTTAEKRRFLCPQCGVSLGSSTSLSKHIRCVHSHTEKQCPHCDERFPSLILLTRHKKLAHPSVFVCSECGKHMRDKFQLKGHLRTIHKIIVTNDDLHKVTLNLRPKTQVEDFEYTILDSCLPVGPGATFDENLANFIAKKEGNFDSFVVYEEEVIAEEHQGPSSMEVVQRAEQMVEKIPIPMEIEEEIVEKGRNEGDSNDRGDDLNSVCDNEEENVQKGTSRSPSKGAEEKEAIKPTEVPIDMELPPVDSVLQFGVEKECRTVRKKTTGKRKLADFLPEFDRLFTYRCDLCLDEADGLGLRLPNYKKMKLHFRQQHNSKGYVHCCGKKITPNGLLSHYEFHHKSTNCPFCPKILSSMNSLKRHLKNTHTVMPKPESAALMAQYDQYFKYQCNEGCDVSLGTFDQMRKHFQDRHQTMGYVFCCGEMFARAQCRGHLGYHLAPEKYMCAKCRLVLPSRPNLTIHLKANSCEAAEAEEIRFRVIPEAVMKMRLQTQRAYDENFKYICEECGIRDGVDKELPNYFEMRKHFQTEHRMRGYGFCCGRKINCNKFAVHLREHDGTQSIPVVAETEMVRCGQCGQDYKGQRNLEKHIKRVHEGEGNKYKGSERRKCGLCTIKFESHDEYLKHKKDVHKHAQKCEQCPKTLVDIHRLREHVRRIHRTENLNPEDVTCKECGKMYKTKETLRIHFRNKHTNPDLNCPHCSYTTKFRNCFKLHLQKH